MHYSPNFNRSYFLSRLEEKNCNLTQVKIDEVLCLVCYIAAKVSANNAVPSWVVFLVKFLKKEKRGIKAKKAHMKIVLSTNSELVLFTHYGLSSHLQHLEIPHCKTLSN